MTPARFVVSAARRPGPSPVPLRPAASPPSAPPAAGPAGRSTSAPPSAPPAAGPAGRSTSAPPPAGAGPVRRPAFPAGRIAVWQAALAVGFAGIGRGAAVTVAAVVLAAAVLLLGAVRVRGEWLSSVAQVALSFALRRRTGTGDRLPLPRGSVITPAGLITGVDGLTVVVRTPGAELPHLDAGAGGPELDLQLVVHHEPGEDPQTWLAVTARRSPGLASDEVLGRALDNALRHLRRAARATGSGTVLGPAEVRAALLRLARAGAARECWTRRRAGATTQICLRLRTARPEAAARLRDEESGAAVTVALRRTPAGTEGVLRVDAASDDAAERAVARITRLGARTGVRLDRLDGRHGPAVLASLPIGGTL